MSPKAIFDKKNILILGGAGFIGSHLCDEIVKTNKVICLDNFSTGDESNISHLLQNPDFKFINHDVTNAIDLERQPELEIFKVAFQGINQIYFLASPASPKAYQKYPIETLLANSLGLRNALDLAVKYKAQLLYVSSPAVYGETTDKNLVKEDYVGLVNQLGARACYSEAKRFGEALVNNYRQVHNIDAKIVRVFNCYGPRMKLDDGRLIPEFIAAAISGRDITVYGDKNSAGSYFYISDLIKAIIKTMEVAHFGPINLASDWKNKFSDIAEQVIKTTKSKSVIKYQKIGDLYAPQVFANITLAKETLGWFPIVLLEEGLKKTIDYLSAQRGIREPEETE